MIPTFNLSDALKVFDYVSNYKKNKQTKIIRDNQSPYFYKKRLSVFFKTKEILKNLQNGYTTEQNIISDYFQMIEEVRFLFDYQIYKVVKQIAYNAQQMNFYVKETEIELYSTDQSKQIFLKEKNELKSRMHAIEEPLFQIFDTYMQVTIIS